MSDHEHEFHSHFKLYLVIFAALCGFTILSILADVVTIPYEAKIGIVLAVASCKALCVMLIFMHLKFERAWKYLLLTPTIILAATIPFALIPDIGSSYYTPTAPQIREYEARPKNGGGHGHGDDHGDEQASEKPAHH